MPKAPIDTKLLPGLDAKILNELDLDKSSDTKILKSLLDVLNNIFEEFPGLIDETNLSKDNPTKHYKKFNTNIEKRDYSQAAWNLLHFQKLLKKGKNFDKSSTNVKVIAGLINVVAGFLFLQSNQAEQCLVRLLNPQYTRYTSSLLESLEEYKDCKGRSFNYSIDELPIEEITHEISLHDIKELLIKLKAGAIAQLINQDYETCQENVLEKLSKLQFRKVDIKEILKLVKPKNSLNEFLLQQKIIIFSLNKFKDKELLKELHEYLANLVKIINNDGNYSSPQEMIKYLENCYQNIIIPYNKIVTYQWQPKDIKLFNNNYLEYSTYPKFVNRAEFALFAVAINENDPHKAEKFYPKICNYYPREAFGNLLKAKYVYKQNPQEACKHVHLAFKIIQSTNYKSKFSEFENVGDFELYICFGLYQLYYYKK